MIPADRARRALVRLRKGYPLSTGETPAKPPKTSKGKKMDTKAVASAADMQKIQERQVQEEAAGIIRPGTKKG